MLTSHDACCPSCRHKLQSCPQTLNATRISVHFHGFRGPDLNLPMLSEHSDFDNCTLFATHHLQSSPRQLHSRFIAKIKKCRNVLGLKINSRTRTVSTSSVYTNKTSATNSNKNNSGSDSLDIRESFAGVELKEFLVHTPIAPEADGVERFELSDAPVPLEMPTPHNAHSVHFYQPAPISYNDVDAQTRPMHVCDDKMSSNSQAIDKYSACRRHEVVLEPNSADIHVSESASRDKDWPLSASSQSTSSSEHCKVFDTLSSSSLRDRHDSSTTLAPSPSFPEEMQTKHYYAAPPWNLLPYGEPPTAISAQNQTSTMAWPSPSTFLDEPNQYTISPGMSAFHFNHQLLQPIPGLFQNVPHPSRNNIHEDLNSQTDSEGLVSPQLSPNGYGNRNWPRTEGPLQIASTSPHIVPIGQSTITSQSPVSDLVTRGYSLYQQQLNHHLASSNVSDLPKCPDCQQEFKGKCGLSNLNRHINSKHRNSEFRCFWDTCSFVSNRPDNRLQHIKNVHLNHLVLGECLWNNGIRCSDSYITVDSMMEHIRKAHLL